MFDDIISSDLEWYEMALLLIICIVGFIVIIPITLGVFAWYGIKKVFSWSVMQLHDWAFDPEAQHTL